MFRIIVHLVDLCHIPTGGTRCAWFLCLRWSERKRGAELCNTTVTTLYAQTKVPACGRWTQSHSDAHTPSPNTVPACHYISCLQKNESTRWEPDSTLCPSCGSWCPNPAACAGSLKVGGGRGWQRNCWARWRVMDHTNGSTRSAPHCQQKASHWVVKQCRGGICWREWESG